MLKYVFDQPPPFAQPVPIAEDILWLRLPIPYRLDHVNLYLLRDADGFTVIDAGVDDAATRETWRRLLRHELKAGIRRIVVTHHHPDHAGAATWLHAETGAPVLGTAAEWDAWRTEVLQDTPETRARIAAHYRRLGAPDDRLATLTAAKIDSWAHMGSPPAGLQVIEADARIEAGGRSWRRLHGSGHSPDPVMLLDAARDVLIVGDQILPTITPYVGTSPNRPRHSPLDDYRGFLRRAAALADDPLVLPGHGLPFRGLAARAAALLEHHRLRCVMIAEACAGERTVHDLAGALFSDLSPTLVSMAMDEVLSHVNAMIAEGMLVAHEGDGVLRLVVARGCAAP